MPPPQDPPDPLDELLNRFEAPECRPPLKSEVWRRIQAQDTNEDAPAWYARLAAILSRTPAAVLFVACCVLLGLFLAEVRVSRLEHQRSIRLARTYLELVDPVMRADSGGAP